MNDTALYVAVTHTANSDARTGVQTVVRGLVHGLCATGEVELVAWHKPWKSFVLLDGGLRARVDPDCVALPLPVAKPPSKKLLAPLYRSKLWKAIKHWRRFRRSSIHRHPGHRSKLSRAWLIIPEVIYGPELADILTYARRHRMRVAAIFHDAIPVTHPQFVRQEAALHHASYMGEICKADLILPVSEESARELERFAREHELETPPIVTCVLAAEVLGQPRLPAKKAEPNELVQALCVCTLEPRKNHVTLLQAFTIVVDKAPAFRLHLAGDRYRDADHLVDAVDEQAKRQPNLIWHGPLSSSELRNLYEQCDFTVYPSFLEGFGLPVVESLWMRRPSVCSDSSPMSMNAADGGCLVTNVLDPSALADAMLRLINDSDLRAELLGQIDERRFRTWEDYGRGVRSHLAAHVLG